MIQKTLVVGPLQCNCLILACETSKEAIVIDPGDEAQRILDEIHHNHFKVKAILHTHAHFDHICGTKELKLATGAPTLLHSADEPLYNNLPMQGQLFGMTFEPTTPIDRFFEEEEILEFGQYRLQVIHTPGHSPGGVCFKLLNGPEILLSGDTLFRQSVGRTDLWGADGPQLVRSIKDRLFTLGDDIRVFPGHGPSTVIGEERKTNPFLQ